MDKMIIEKDKVVTAIYTLYVDGENGGNEEAMEKATREHPLIYCHGEGMMLPKFEEQMLGLAVGDSFDFRIACADAYGEYDTDGVMTLDKKLFFNGDGEFDAERVYQGAIVPMNTVDGQIVNAQVVEITDDKVTIDLNHPLAGENLHFVGEVIDMRDVTPGELKAMHHHCGGCHGHCQGEGEGECGGHCKEGQCDEGNCGEGHCDEGHGRCHGHGHCHS